MPRINIHEDWWIDQRRQYLVVLLKDPILADGLMLNLWRVAQTYWSQKQSGIPINVFERFNNYKHVLDCGLASADSEFVYIKGSKDNFDWLLKAKEMGARGGKAKARNHSGKNLGSSRVSKGNVPSSSSSSSNTNIKKEKSPIGNRGEPALGVLLFDYYLEQGTKKGITILPPGVKERSIAKRLLGLVQNDLEKAKMVVDAYLSDNQTFFSNSSYPFSLISHNLQKYLTNLDSGKNKTKFSTDPDILWGKKNE